ncbi:hypothetical protein BGW36DRAFT_184689 [Talaromyces proteolyticus]|uniref:Uncharacterized protein n=1 Tax=Talaromyces proteolyticus TaxID=1131652 RepID=A0AAD4KP85_9EURO|nr:uncharacterized protein BGW36DRAFT_184689 [Talaromyces proteolyticus]KAH8696339.1 hypothetical protein BGW36DRAFT_184689 [Talaromyces proteolyticus]
MSAANDSTLRLKFLQSSAKLLGAQSVSTAAHLISVHNGLLYENLKPLKPRQHETWCGACGSPRDKEHTKISKIKQRRSLRNGQVASKDAIRDATVYQCLRCNKRMTRYLQPQIRKQHEQTNAPTKITSNINQHGRDLSTPTESLPSPLEADVSKSVLDNASSKKRAKARKQGGLQAVLASKARTQTARASTSSLDLLDFLQQ